MEVNKKVILNDNLFYDNITLNFTVQVMKG